MVTAHGMCVCMRVVRHQHPPRMPLTVVQGQAKQSTAPSLHCIHAKQAMKFIHAKQARFCSTGIFQTLSYQ